MGTYQRIHPRVPEGIAAKKAYLVGGGIGSLSAAAFLIRDGHMPGKNIHILEESPYTAVRWTARATPKTATARAADAKSKSISNVLWSCSASSRR